MTVQFARMSASGIAAAWVLCVIVIKLSQFSNSVYYWLWGMPIIIISLLNLYFLYQSLKQKPKNVDTRLSTFLISIFSTIGLGMSSMFVSYPPIDIQYVAQLKRIGIVISIIPYPFTIWALLCLRNCLTILPEAHRVVARGIYKYSRHPLYVCYMVWSLANMLMFLSIPMITISILEIVFQVLRYRREEELLLATLPEYREYYQQTGLVGRKQIKV